MAMSNRQGAALRQLTEASRLMTERMNVLTEMQKDAERAADKALAERQNAVGDARREYEKLIDSISRVTQEKLGDVLFDTLRGETVDFAEFMKDVLLRAVGDIAATASIQQIVNQILERMAGETLTRTRANAAHDVARRAWRPARRKAAPDQRMKLIMRGHRRRRHRRR